MIQKAVSITLLCYKCLRERTITGVSREDCDAHAIGMGWVNDNGRMICEKCPAPRYPIARERAA